MTLGSHQRTVGDSQTWLTPKWIIDALGPFDLDPCAAFPPAWNCATENWVRDGLSIPWFGRVWLNPPFDRYEVGKWIKRMALHGNGIALLHARTETEWFRPVWERAKGILFLANRIHFYHLDGSRAEANSGAPPCLVAFSDEDLQRLAWAMKQEQNFAGALVLKWVMV